ncbi:hypothetical protein GX48_07657 [Paracoccidioides brasiliensis]|nr:hypothetical protein GX48_07657 [Paracoccidioides brasiliensis]
MPPTPTLTTTARPLLHTPSPLTLIVATTPITMSTLNANAPSNFTRRCLGIGHGGTLPWPSIKADMKFFSRVTTHAPPHSLPSSLDSTGTGRAVTAVNAVIMGRRTYDSLPTRFRPLPGRVNVVVTRDGSGKERERIEEEWRAVREREKERKRRGDGLSASGGDTSTSTTIVENEIETPDVLIANSLESAVTALYDAFQISTDDSHAVPPGPLSHNSTRYLANIFIIGGSEIYASALNLNCKLDAGVPDCQRQDIRIVMTDIRRLPAALNDATADGATATSVKGVEDSVNGFECDTFFPLDEDELERGDGEWRRVSCHEVSGPKTYSVSQNHIASHTTHPISPHPYLTHSNPQSTYHGTPAAPLPSLEFGFVLLPFAEVIMCEDDDTGTPSCPLALDRESPNKDEQVVVDVILVPSETALDDAGLEGLEFSEQPPLLQTLTEFEGRGSGFNLSARAQLGEL